MKCNRCAKEVEDPKYMTCIDCRAKGKIRSQTYVDKVKSGEKIPPPLANLPAITVCPKCEIPKSTKDDFSLRTLYGRETIQAYCKTCSRDEHLARRYDLTGEQFDTMAAAQGFTCAVCEEPPPEGQRLHVDHDHVTGYVRGLLCRGCNVGAGNLKDDPVRIRALAAYLESKKGK